MFYITLHTSLKKINVFDMTFLLISIQFKSRQHICKKIYNRLFCILNNSVSTY